MARKKLLYEDYVNKDVLEKITFYKRRGHTDEQLYKMIGIGSTTGKNWKNKYPSFLSAFKKGLDESIMKVENAYYKRAVGHFVTEKEETIVYGKDGEIVNKTVKTKQKYVWSDTNAANILRRRDYDYWGEKLEVNVSNVDEYNIAMEEIQEKIKNRGK